MTDIEEMKLDMVKELANILMQNQPMLTMNEALSTVFQSETYEKMIDDKTKLYYQSPGYVFSFLMNEIETGKLG